MLEVKEIGDNRVQDRIDLLERQRLSLGTAAIPVTKFPEREQISFFTSSLN
jgi:hypothetical protein